MKARLAHAREAMRGEGARRKAEAVAQVIGRLVCHLRAPFP